MDANDIKKDFKIFENQDIVYLDNAATTQKPDVVIKSIEAFYKSCNANPHRGAYSLSIEATQLYENAREKVAKFLNTSQAEEIIFTKNATEALNLIAYSYALNTLKKDDEIVISILEHHSNLVPWQMVAKVTGAKLKYMYINENFEIDDAEIKEKITSNTKIVSVTHVSNVTGTVNDIGKIIKYAHKKGAVCVVDASQSVPHIKVDVKSLNVDFLVFSGHKMLAPLGIGVLYAKKQILNNMTPFLMGGDMIEYVHEQTTTFAPLPNKFEAGTQNVEGAVGLASAIDYLENIGFENIKKYVEGLCKYAVTKLSKLDFIKLYLPESAHVGAISFNVKGVHPHDVASILDSKGICVRSGNHCAQPLLRYLNEDSTCRASFYIYNTKEDVDKLVEGLQQVYRVFEKYIVK